MYARHVGFWESVQSGFRNYFRFSGRAQRAEYWWFYLFCVLCQAILTVFDVSIFGVDVLDDDFSPLADIFALVTVIPVLALGWRRMHDINRSGWWSLLPLAPMLWAVIAAIVMFTSDSELTAVGVGVVAIGVIATFAAIIYVIVLLATDSDVGPNRYGQSVKYSSDDEPSAGEIYT